MRRFTKKVLVACVSILILVSLLLMFGGCSQSCSSCGKLSESEVYSLVEAEWEESKKEMDNPIIHKFGEVARYEPVSVTTKDGVYTVTYNIWAPNIKDALTEYLEENRDTRITISETEELLCDLIESNETVETEAQVFIVKENGEYHVFFSDAFFDAMYGGIYSFSMDAFSQPMD